MNTREFLTYYQKLEPKLFAFAMKLTRSKSNADDLIQETTFRAYANRNQFQKGTNFKSWISTIMKNTFINKYRSHRRRNVVDGSLEDHAYDVQNKSVSASSESIIMMQELSLLISRVKPKYRIPFLMHYKGYEYQEIAQELDIPIGTVKSRLYTARQKLSKMVKETYGESHPMRA